MQYRRLGASDLIVSAVGLGSWLTYGDHVARDVAQACIRRAYDLGVTLFDCANVYGRGEAEVVLGESLRSVPRDSVVLTSKLYFPMARGDLGLSAAQVVKQCEASLRRLDTDYLDLYQCHRFDRQTPLEETMTALTGLVTAGKVRHVGFSEWTVDQITAAAALPTVVRFTSSQPEYSLLHRDPEREVFDRCRRLGIGNIVYSPLAQGVLTGKYRSPAEPPEGSRAATRATRAMMGRYLTGRARHRVDRLRRVAQAADMTMTELALSWVLRDPVVSSAIVGASRPEQLDETAARDVRTLDADLLRVIDAASLPPS